MTDPALSGLAHGAAGRPIARRRGEAARLPVRVDLPGAKVMLLPGRYRDDKYVRVHVSYVVKMEADKGERHIIRNLGAIERNLREIGVDEAAIAAELRMIEARVRSELWRQVLTPDDQP